MTFAPADFTRETFDDGLRNVGFDENAPAFFSWLGVTMYLETDLVLGTLRAIHEMHAANGVVFDYAVPRETLGLVGRLALDAVSRRVKKAGEPFKGFFAPAELVAKLRDMGYAHIEDLGSRGDQCALLQRAHGQASLGKPARSFGERARVAGEEIGVRRARAERKLRAWLTTRRSIRRRPSRGGTHCTSCSRIPWDSRPMRRSRRKTASLLTKLAKPDGGGWSAVARVIGSVSDTMMVHFRPTLNAIGDVQKQLDADPYIQRLVSTYTFLSITEAGLYHITAELARDAVARGGSGWG